MSRAAVLPLAALAVALAGCPLPQPLPEYSAGTVTPPRILVDEIARATLKVDGGLSDGVPGSGNPGDGNAIVFVPANCPSTSPVYYLWARVVDTNNTESIDARWFVNYDPGTVPDSTWIRQYTIAANVDTNNLVREIPPRAGGVRQFFEFRPYEYGAALGAPQVVAVDRPPSAPPGNKWYPQEGVLRVVELVVSNGFDASPVTASSVLPNRAARSGFETQVYRWVFLTVPPSATVRCDSF
jgi:hypothetical protein